MSTETPDPTPQPKRVCPKGICAGCGRARHLRKGGTVGAHRKLTVQGYNAGVACPGVDQLPVEAEIVR
jgi:hypothetical protein